MNKPFSFDFHGNLPLETPFEKIPPEQIHLYLDVDTSIGKDACMQACEHCWFVNYPSVQKKQFDKKMAKKLFLFLKNKGYNVYPRYTDSFTKDGEMFKLFGSARNKSFRMLDNQYTETMLKGECWTSGRPLLKDNRNELLQLARENNYGTIVITFHGLLDEKLNILEEYPIKGVLHGKEFLKVIDVINNYNKNFNYNFKVNVGVTVGKHNCDKKMLIRYVKFFNKIDNIQVLRFNNFSAHNVKFKHLELSKNDRKQFFKDIKWIHSNIPFHYQLAVSEDFGTDGYEVLGYPENVGICKAGLQLFVIIPFFDKNQSQKKEVKIANIAGCVNVFEPILGEIFYLPEKDSFKIKFDINEINKLQNKRLNKVYKNGCFSQELRKEKYGY